ncbi:MAG TPA: TetR/AcrR family transcriptional regulator [Mycobacteriales bacterium]|nr:TetR/AcrR family transcriptional regulator [Mycobacteriales bacterium]
MAQTKERKRAPSTTWRTASQPDLSPILAGALDAFYDDGYHGTSVRDIARRANLTVPALYYHHANKEAILYALLDSSINRVIENCELALSDAGTDQVQRFLNLVECQVLYLANNTKSAAMDAEIRSLSSENRRAYSERRRVIEYMLQRTIEGGVGAGSFNVSNPSATSRALLGMIQAIATWFRADGELSVQALARQYLEIAAQTVGASSRVLELARQPAARR